MKFRILLLLGLVVFIFQACEESTSGGGKIMGPVKLDEKNPKPGDNIKITYQSEEAQLPDSAFSASYYTIVGKKSYAYDMKMHATDSIWETQIPIPDSATAVAFNFKVNGKFKTNQGRGFVQPLYDQNGKRAPGALASMANYYLQYDERFGYRVEADSMLKWFRTDFKAHPEVEKKYSGIYADFLYNHDKNQGETYIKHQLGAYQKKDTLSEEAYGNMVEFYSLLGEREKSDSVAGLAAKKFPKSRMAQMRYVLNFDKAESMAEKRGIFEDYEGKIGKEGPLKDSMLNALAQSALLEDDFEKFKDYTTDLSDKERAASILNRAAGRLIEEDEDLETAGDLANKALELVNPYVYKDRKSSRPQNEYEEHLKEISPGYRATYAKALFKQGYEEEALYQQEKAVKSGKKVEINEDYIHYLIEAEKYDKAQEKAAAFIKKGQANAAIKKNFKAAFRQQNDSDKALNDTLSELEKESHSENE